MWPKPSPSSALSATPGLSWVTNYRLDPGRPLGDPNKTFTAPAWTMPPRSSPATPTARSACPSPLKSFEPTLGERPAKAVPGLGRADHAGTALGEELTPASQAGG